MVDDDQASPNLCPEVAARTPNDRWLSDRLADIHAGLSQLPGIVVEHHHVGVWKAIEELGERRRITKSHDVSIGVIADARLPVIDLIDADGTVARRVARDPFSE